MIYYQAKVPNIKAITMSQISQETNQIRPLAEAARTESAAEINKLWSERDQQRTALSLLTTTIVQESMTVGQQLRDLLTQEIFNKIDLPRFRSIIFVIGNKLYKLSKSIENRNQESYQVVCDEIIKECNSLRAECDQLILRVDQIIPDTDKKPWVEASLSSLVYKSIKLTAVLTNFINPQTEASATMP